MKISHSFMCFCRMDESFSENHQQASFVAVWLSTIFAFANSTVLNKESI